MKRFSQLSDGQKAKLVLGVVLITWIILSLTTSHADYVSKLID